MLESSILTLFYFEADAVGVETRSANNFQSQVRGILSVADCGGSGSIVCMTGIQPPTDNLYKFMAIFGLVLIAIGLFIYDKRLNEVTKTTAEADSMIKNLEYINRLQELDTEFLRYELKPLKDESSRLQDRAKSLLEEANSFESLPMDNKKSNENAAAEFRNKVDIISQELETLDQSVFLISKKHAQLVKDYVEAYAPVHSKHTESLYLKSVLSRTTIPSRFCVLCGSLISSLGFYLWYVRLQKYQDMEAKAKAS